MGIIISEEQLLWAKKLVDEGESVRSVAKKMKQVHGIKISHVSLGKTLKKLTEKLNKLTPKVNMERGKLTTPKPKAKVTIKEEGVEKEDIEQAIVSIENLEDKALHEKPTGTWDLVKEEEDKREKEKREMEKEIAERVKEIKIPNYTKATALDLKLKVMRYLGENNNSEDDEIQKALRNLTSVWGGSGTGGGHWSGHWLCLFKILEKIGVYVREEEK